MKEAGVLMNKMQNMPGMPNMQDLFKNMNMPKQNIGKAKQQMNNSVRVNGQRERLQRKLEQRKMEKEQNNNIFDGKTFSDGSEVNRSKAKSEKK